ncbi:8-oxoguanine DNA-glycosylase [Hypoxylon rubiginosum]|uniref:8-oxoguanine DNA-glycosylase n=1 Tax=Hypoxylon rubiginosum TaxID=110542 RepID=A0ACC0DM73_9PEZI|nr:8-oxoguanine DNA-glycosylase [Hypoxylon rubiginosum]
MHPGHISEWRKLPLTLADLCIETTLRCGQSFRWRKINDEWNCVLHGRLLSLKQDKDHLHYRVLSTITTPPVLTPPSPIKSESDINEDDTEALLKHYFSLKHDLGTLYEQWSKSDANFRKKAPKFTGIRILSQDPWEALIAFICSSNNNISRISQMVHKLCVYYGPLVGHIGDEAFHDFPTPQALSGSKVEAHLRELGFGYRAKYIAETARIVTKEKPEGWLEGLINPDNPGWPATKISKDADPPTYRYAHEQLLLLSGVGPKVADCVCLMGLGWGEAVPVDTHVWQIAQRDYKFGKVKTKTFSKVMYDSVGDHFRKIWGPHAGWAQSVLFTANLKSFSEQASSKVEPVEVKVEIEEIEQNVIVDEATPLTRKRRRATVVETVKIEEHTPIETARTVRKSRRTKA